MDAAWLLLLLWMMRETMRDRLMNQPTIAVYTSPRSGMLAACLHGQDGRLWCYRTIFPPLPCHLLTNPAIDDAATSTELLVASLGLRSAFIGRAHSKLHTLYTARGMAGYCTRMACEGVLTVGRIRICATTQRAAKLARTVPG